MNGFSRHLRLTTLVICCSWYATAGAQAVSPGINTELGAGFESFLWEEYDDGDNRLLTESGPRVFLSGIISNAFDNTGNNFILEAAVKAYAGKVDYDGQDNNGISVGSKTRYAGYSLELTGGYRIRNSLDVDILAGAGVNAWSREISDSQNAVGSPVNGILEEYTIQYFTLAAGFPLQFSSHEGYLKIGLRRPFATRERVDRFDVTLAPHEKNSGMASYKFLFDNHKSVSSPLSSITIYYEGFRFDNSPAKAAVLNGTPVQVRQPRSYMDIVGFTIGHTF